MSPSRVLEGAAHVTAVLGPTNTGKTHRAIEQMLHHRSGMIGLPLRLLAREVYDRVVAAKGPDQVALVTGEEKVIPREPRYFVCTVEAMPIDRPVAFLAVDEIQLAGDRNRGHVFTDRILNARGVLETMFLGSDTIEALLYQLVPNIRIDRQPRLSKLSYAGCTKLGAVPRRTAVVAFSAEQVYAHAERLRSLHGGAAVVLGALSPRTRNAQVAMYQSGEVQHIVATDAIGMGLNMDVRHVAFTALRKYDGREIRDLTSAEIAQIAGRAGRYTTDGTFGTTREVGELDPALVHAVEHHAFPPLTRLYWRSSALDTSSAERLLASLRRRAPHPALVQVRDEDDERALEALIARGDLPLDDPEAVRIVWEVCQIPDYRKTMTGSHVELLHRIASQLLRDRRLSDDWIARRLERLDDTEGDIETLMARIAYVRTWTYVSFQRDWLADPTAWQERTRQLEDRLSDALHDRLTRRFVDQRLMLVTSAPEGALVVDGDTVRIAPPRPTREPASEAPPGIVMGHLSGLDLQPVAGARRLYAALRRSLVDEIAARVEQLASARDEEITLDERHRLIWRDGVVGWLEAGPGPLEPVLRVARLDLLEPPQKERVRRRLAAWVDQEIGRLLGPLRSAEVQALRGAPRGLVYALEQALGSVPRPAVRAQVDALTKADRDALAKLDVRLGTETIFVRRMLRPDAVARRARWWCLAHAETVRSTPVGGRSSLPIEPYERPFYEAIGYRPLGRLAVRADVVERVAAQVRTWARAGEPVSLDPLVSWMGCRKDEAEGVVVALGYRPVDAGDGKVRLRRAGEGRRARGPTATR